MYQIRLNNSNITKEVNFLAEISPEEEKQVISIVCSNQGLKKLDVMERFTNLKTFICWGNQLSSLPDLSKFSNMRVLSCRDNQLTSLPKINQCKKLRILVCGNNKITSLPDLRCFPHLKILHCINNHLIELPIVPNRLKSLFCRFNYLTGDKIPSQFHNFRYFDNLREQYRFHYRATQIKKAWKKYKYLPALGKEYNGWINNLIISFI